MTKSTQPPVDSLHKLSAAFAARRARLAFDLSHVPRRIAPPRPIARLQDHGYAIATGLAATAVLPFILRFLLRRKKLLFKLVMAIFRFRKFGRSVAAPSRVPVRMR